ncbi:hypothetical protein K438DRAFT_2138348 [Mycena galopus ATCC 62051]|nr:hypothetical protein K438DRAFT_2138348 [Mycena galopus ATCC 62051]
MRNSFQRGGPSSSDLTLNHLSLPGDKGMVDDAGKSLLPQNDTSQWSEITENLSDTISATRKSRFQIFSLRILCLVLHGGLVLLHLVLLIIGAKRMEHNLVFSTEHQAEISFLVTTLVTGIGIIYFSSTLFVTQKLMMRHNLRAYQTLTATHDNIYSLTGLGSALAVLYRQLEVRASLLGPISVASYLICISLLHITTPAIFSVPGFNASTPLTVQTLGLPNWNTSVDVIATGAFADMALQFFPWMGTLEESQKIGLFNGSLYETLVDVRPGRGRGQVSATGFNITCPNIITTNVLSDPPNNSVVLYTTNAVVDSEGGQGFPVELTPPMNYSITHLQFLQCWRTLVPQEGTPSIYKTQSSWKQYSDSLFSPADSTLVGGDLWALIPEVPVDSTIPMSDNSDHFSAIEEYLMEWLGLEPSWISTGVEPSSVPTLALHDIENALSALMATAFWLRTELVPPVLAVAQTLIPRLELHIRLQISVIAVSIGLGASILMCLMTVPYALSDSGSQLSVEKTGLLQIIWIFRRHTELNDSLPQVADPTDTNLRTAGLVTVKLSGHSSAVKETTQGNRAKDSTYPKDDIQFRTRNPEHAVIFPVASQHSVALWITVISTVIGTRLAIQTCIGNIQTLTAAHDQVLSWAGVGSAVSVLFSQLELQAAIAGPLSVGGYLATIALLHVTTPALFAIETFDHTFSADVRSQGVPLWNGSDTGNVSSPFLQDVGNFFPWIHTLLEQNETIGLFNGSLYDVLAGPVSATAPANISASGFNVTCGYIPNINITASNVVNASLAWNITLPNGFMFQPSSSGPNILTTQAQSFGSASAATSGSWPSMILYTTNQVIDSDGNTGFPIDITPPMGPNSTVSQLQILQYSRSLVPQLAQVEADSRLVIPSSIQPSLYKTTSQWNIHDDSSQGSNNLDPLKGSEWPIPLGRSSVPMSILTDDDRQFAWMDLYLMENLDLDPSWIKSGEVSTQSTTLHLHEIENALSSLIASYFWMGSYQFLKDSDQQLILISAVGHIRPGPLMIKYGVDENGNPAMNQPPVLSEASVTVIQTEPAIRLNVSIGLGASILALLLSMRFIPPRNRISSASLTGLGILHLIWLFRNHPSLSNQLDQVDEPTNMALRSAGMIRVQLDAKAEEEEMEMLVGPSTGVNCIETASAKSKRGLVIGGGTKGIRGVVASAVLEGGGNQEARGQAALQAWKMCCSRVLVVETIVFNSMNDRNGDGEMFWWFFGLPGAFGTLDEVLRFVGFIWFM